MSVQSRTVGAGRRLEAPADRTGVAGGAVALGVVLVLAAALRTIRLGEHSLWFDELWVAWIVGHGWPALFTLIRSTDAHPPLYYALMKLWTADAGTGEAALRLPSACLGVAAAALTYLVGRRLASEPAALLGALFVAVSPFAVMASREARMYPLLTVLVLAATLVLMSGVERGRARFWAAYAAIAALVVYTHYLGALVLLAHGLWVGVFERRRLASWAAAVAAASLAFLPWLPALTDQLLQVHHMYLSGWFRMKTGMLDLGEVLGLLAFGGSLFGLPGYLSGGTAAALVKILVLCPFAVLLAQGVWVLSGRPRTLALLALPVVVVLGIAFAASLLKVAVFPRWFSFLEPFYALLLAAGIAGAGSGRRWIDVAVLGLAAALCGAPVLEPYYTKPEAGLYQWRAAAAEIVSHATGADAFVYAGWQPYIALTYYLRTAHPSLIVAPDASGAGVETIPSLQDFPNQLASRFRRAWVIVTIPRTPDDPFIRSRLLPELGSHFRPAARRDFGGIWVYLFVAR